MIEYVIPNGFDSAEEAGVDAAHNFCGEEARAVFFGEMAPGLRVIAPGAFALKGHQVDKGRVVGAGKEVLFGVPKAMEVFGGQVNAVLQGIGPDVPEDVGKLEGDAQVDRVVPGGGIAVAEDFDAD